MQVRLYRNYKSTLWGEGGIPLSAVNENKPRTDDVSYHPYDRLNASGSVGEIPLHADSQNMCRGSTAP